VARIVSIDEPSDLRLACYADLRWDTKPGPDVDWFVVEGRFCVERLIESPLELLSILVARGKEAEAAAWLTDDTPVYSLPVEAIRSLVGYDFHRGILACGRRPIAASIDSLVFAEREPRLALAAVGVNERENLGSMMRTAAALGIKQVLIGPRTADPYSRRAVRVSMAAALKLRLIGLRQPVSELRRLQETGRFRTVVTTLSPDATTLDRFVADHRACILVMGNEADGIDPEIEEIATDRVTIPMGLGTDSLNVSVAAAIFMYELTARLR
jgi:tRNA G18 (ribose-2'-O)-methylase SpoU